MRADSAARQRGPRVPDAAAIRRSLPMWTVRGLTDWLLGLLLTGSLLLIVIRESLGHPRQPLARRNASEATHPRDNRWTPPSGTIEPAPPAYLETERQMRALHPF